MYKLDALQENRCRQRSYYIPFDNKAGALSRATFNFKDKDPAARWFLSQIISYMQSEEFSPKYFINVEQLYELANRKVKKAEDNKNIAFNPNDKTATRTVRQTEGL